MLSGYRTTIVAILLGVATVLKSLGYLDETTFNTITTLLGSAGMLALRAAITNNGTKAPPEEK